MATAGGRSLSSVNLSKVETQTLNHFGPREHGVSRRKTEFEAALMFEVRV